MKIRSIKHSLEELESMRNGINSRFTQEMIEDDQNHIHYMRIHPEDLLGMVEELIEFKKDGNILLPSGQS